MADNFSARVLRPGPAVTAVGMKAEYVPYRTGLATAQPDSTPVGLDTPANTSGNYHNANASPALPKPINMSWATNLHVRVRFSDSGATANVVVVGWGDVHESAHNAGDVISSWTATAGSQRDGDGAAGSYISARQAIDMRFYKQAHIFVTAVSAGTADVDVARD